MMIIRIIVQIAILYTYYYAGVIIVDFLNVPFPGSIVGLLLLFLSLHFKWIKVEFIRDGAGFLIGVLTLFFIPTTVGVIEYPQLWTVEGLLVLLAVSVSTIVVIFVTGKVSLAIELKEKQTKGQVSQEEKTIV